jgi:hypothetical protein
MQRRRMAAWLLSLPLMVLGTQVAHVFAYRLVYPSARVRLGELLASGHSYMSPGRYLPMLLGVAFAAEAVAVGWLIVGAVRRTGHKPVPPLAFALLPVLGFTLQELFERWLIRSSFPWWMVLQPTFRLGFLLQLPFALLAFLLARLLFRTAKRIGNQLRGSMRRGRTRAPRATGWCVREARPVRLGALALGYSRRGPPRLAPAPSEPCPCS